MPPENSEVIPGKVFIQTEEDAEPKELKVIDINIEKTQEEKYIEQKAKGYTGQGTITFNVKLTEKMKRMLGVERITRKRFKKLLMGCGMQRNDAEVVAQAFNENGIRYTPLGIQKIIETINEEAEKEEKENEKI